MARKPTTPKLNKEQIMHQIRNTILFMIDAKESDRRYFDILKNRLQRLKNQYVEAGGKDTDNPFESIAQNDK